LGNPLGTLWEDIENRKKTKRIFFQLYIKKFSQFNWSH
jgi:hypothetical protein